MLSIVRGEPTRCGSARRRRAACWSPTPRGAACAACSATRGPRRPAPWMPCTTLDVPPHERVRLTTHLVPTRRGDRLADRVTVRVLGPLGLAARQGSVPVPGSVRALPPFPSRKHLPSRLAGCASSTGGPRCASAARAPSSTPCASTSTATTSAPSTGAPPPGASTSSCAPGGRSAPPGRHRPRHLAHLRRPDRRRPAPRRRDGCRAAAGRARRRTRVTGSDARRRPGGPRPGRGQRPGPPAARPIATLAPVESRLVETDWRRWPPRSCGSARTAPSSCCSRRWSARRSRRGCCRCCRRSPPTTGSSSRRSATRPWP